MSTQLEYTPRLQRRLVARKSGKSLVLWNAGNAREICRFEQHEQSINAIVAMSGRRSLRSDRDRLLRVRQGPAKIVIKGGEYQYVDLQPCACSTSRRKEMLQEDQETSLSGIEYLLYAGRQASGL